MLPASRVFGHGPRRVLAIHCTLAHAGAWRGVGAAIADRATVTAFDLPGHGTGPVFDPGWDLHDHSVALAQPFLADPVDLVGHSFGATVALRLTLERPGIVRSLTLVAPVFFAIAQTEAPGALAAYMAREQPCFAALDAGDMALAARLFHRRWGDGTAWADLRETTRRYMTERIHMLPAQNSALFEDKSAVLAPGRLERLTMPCLAVQGAETQPIIDVIHAGLGRRIPQMRRRTIAGAGHMAPVTHPKAVAAEIGSLFEMTEE